MSIYGHRFDNLLESKQQLSDVQKEQQKLYYDAKKLSDDHKFTEARKVINSMNDNKGENNYRIWAVAYMNRRKSEVSYESKSEDQKEKIDTVQKELKKKIIIDLAEKGLKAVVSIASGVMYFNFTSKAKTNVINYMNSGLNDIIETVADAARLIAGVYETEKGFEITTK